MTTRHSVVLFALTAALLAGCLPKTAFKVTLRLEDEQTGRPIPNALVLAGAYVTVSPPFDEPYDRPFGAARGMTDSDGALCIAHVDGLYRGETPQGPLWEMLESRKPVVKRKATGIEGGSLLIFAPGYGVAEQPFGVEDDARFRKIKATRDADGTRDHYSWFWISNKLAWYKPLVLLENRDFGAGKTITVTMSKPALAGTSNAWPAA